MRMWYKGCAEALQVSDAGSSPVILSSNAMYESTNDSLTMIQWNELCKDAEQNYTNTGVATS